MTPLLGKVVAVLAIVAPGQGAQTPGYMAPWLEVEAFARHFQQLADVAELDLIAHGTTSAEQTIKDTKVAQPLLVASALTAYRALDLPGAPAQLMAAGHSVGEFAAAAIAGALSDDEAIVLVRERGRAMAEASAARPTSMTAIIGGKPDDVLATLEELGLTAANNNGKGQIVAAGTVEQLEELAANPPQRTRLFPLSVAGAFHTVHMEPAVQHLAATAGQIQPRDPQCTLLSNADGAAVETGVEVLHKLVNQVANPVRWDLCMATMAEAGVTGMLELNPAGTLTGIAKRNLSGVELFNLNTPDQLDEARAFVAQHD